MQHGTKPKTFARSRRELAQSRAVRRTNRCARFDLHAHDSIGLFSLGPVYAARSGFMATGVSTFMAASILPAIALQLPLGRYSDRIDRRTVLIAMAVAAAAAGSAALLLGHEASIPFFAAVVVYGGLSLTTYALCVSHINDHLQPDQMVAASGSIILLNRRRVRAAARVGRDAGHGPHGLLRQHRGPASRVCVSRNLAKGAHARRAGAGQDPLRRRAAAGRADGSTRGAGSETADRRLRECVKRPAKVVSRRVRSHTRISKPQSVYLAGCGCAGLTGLRSNHFM